LGFAAGLSDQQRSFGVIAGLGSEVFHTLVPILAQIVEPQAVFLRVGDVEQAVFELDPLGRIDQALKYGSSGFCILFLGQRSRPSAGSFPRWSHHPGVPQSAKYAKTR
jgi:hypothetical protein